jgi:hypothetical protein
MKKLLLALSLAFCSALQSFAYGGGYDDCPKIYLGISGGVDNPAGIIGFNLDVPIVPNFSLGAGVGPTLWGQRVFAEARGYLKPCHRGLAFGAGFSYNTGLKSKTVDVQDAAGNQIDGSIELKPVKNAFASAYYFFNLGRRSRFYLQGGYSYCLDGTGNYSIVTPGFTIDPDVKTVMDALQPGGVVFGLGFSFGIGGGR